MIQRETRVCLPELQPLADNKWDSRHTTAVGVCEADLNRVSCCFYSQAGKQRLVVKNNQDGLNVPYLLAPPRPQHHLDNRGLALVG